MTQERSGGSKWLPRLIALAVTTVVSSPLALSFGHLVRWSENGLGLEGLWRYLPPVALDAAAATCVFFVVYAGLRGERPGRFGLMTWAFAGGSAAANWIYGQSTTAPHDSLFFAAMSLAAPLLLHAVVDRLRQWQRTDAGEALPRRPSFGMRWLVSPWETLDAWATAVRLGISRPDAALAAVRERRYLSEVEPHEAIQYALGATGAGNVHTLRVWLADRKITVDTATLAAVLEGAPVPVAELEDSDQLDTVHAAALEERHTKADKIRFAFEVLGSYDTTPVVRWLARYGVDVGRSQVHDVREREQERRKSSIAVLRAEPVS